MSREIRHVPLDFDWPIDTVWQGYLMPDELSLPPCPDCAYGDSQYPTGFSPQAHAISRSFYPRWWAKDAAWHDKLDQDEVDMLVAAGRLRELRSRQPTADNPRTREWVTVPRTADEVNAANRTPPPGLGNPLVHDGINQGLLTEFRCTRSGLPYHCATCNGEAHLATPEQLAALEAWEPVGPPVGEGWQLWETVSEGSPQSPVFATADELATWMSDPDRGHNWVPGAVAAQFIAAGWAPTAVSTNDRSLTRGVEYIGTQDPA